VGMAPVALATLEREHFASVCGLGGDHAAESVRDGPDYYA